MSMFRYPKENLHSSFVEEKHCFENNSHALCASCKQSFFLISFVLAVEMAIFGSQTDYLWNQLMHEELIIPERDFT